MQFKIQAGKFETLFFAQMLLFPTFVDNNVDRVDNFMYKPVLIMQPA